ncbi:ThuA domain-containing protein [Ruminococcaceae bacterium OttesenSCG-928-L11]|nr:ThuA domain-containing protein [Ruminococcaceae bacterium OttesenSCG-928-L11]
MTNVLVVCDSPWHPAEVIEWGLAPLEGDEFHFVFVKAAKDILTPERIAGYPLILCCKGNAVTEANNNPWFEDTVTEVGPKEFEDYIRAGGGFMAIHAGTIGKKDTPYGDLVGCVFNGHPLRCGIDVKVTGDHPILNGVAKDFHIRDEHYQMTVTADDAVELFRTVSETGGDQPAGWVREMGDGRMAVLTPGHCVDVFYNPEFQKILVNSMRWCLKK